MGVSDTASAPTARLAMAVRIEVRMRSGAA
jgi:hypothetical protein